MANSSTVLVTGGASGIGLAVVEALREAGVAVLVFDNDPQALGNIAKVDGALHCKQIDVTDEGAIGPAIDRGMRALGPISGVVNAAGIGCSVPAAQTDAATFRKILDVNLDGSFIVAREAAARMPTGGSIVNITSVSGIRGNAGRAAYGASKRGVDALTRVLGAEWAEKSILVNAIAPGPIDTPLARRVHDETTRREWARLVPMRRYGKPCEVAGAILFLLDGRASGFITGQTICVDGGFTCAGLREGES